ncbi:AAA family ATPase [Cohnella soli]|uniref:CpaE family protein n=1 Tax=Cohnella soli TaxID=425005 RepID=A0ABW0HPE5_9BACL
MKITFAFSKPNLAEAAGKVINKEVETTFAFNEEELTRALNKSGRELDFIFAHEEIFNTRYPWEWISYIKTSVGIKTKIVILLSESTDSWYREIIKRLSVDLEISLIPSGLTIDEIAEEIGNRVYPKTKTSDENEGGRLAAVMSASPKDGATTIAISTAICAAMRMPDKTVLLVDFNLKSPEVRDQLNIQSDRGYQLIQSDCDSGTLEQSALLKACEKLKDVPNLHILTGNQRREWAEKITIDEIGHFLAVARKTFDLIIADVHTFPDQAATLKCMKNADERIVVVQPIVTSYQSSWNDWFNSVWQHYGMKETDFHLVLNRDNKGALEGFSIEKAMGTKIVARVRNVDKGAGIKAINYGQPLYLNEGVETNEFRDNILQLTSWIAERIGVELVPLQKDSKAALKGKRKLFGII